MSSARDTGGGGTQTVESSTPGTDQSGGGRFDRRAAARLLGGALLLVVVAPFVVHMVPALVGADASFVVLSGSMEPTISAGDSVLVADVPPSAVERGDVITYATGESAPTTHRVIEVVDRENGVAFRTKGDANPQPDGRLVTPDRLRGEVVAVLPMIGYVLRFGSTPRGRLLLLGVPIALLVVSEAWSIARAHWQTDEGPEVPPPGEAETTAAEGSNAATESNSGGSDLSSPAPTTVEADSSPRAEESQIELTRADLRATLVVLGLLTTYSVTVAVLEQSFWSVGVAVAGGGCLLLGVALWYSAPTTPEAETVSSASPPDRPTATVSVEELVAVVDRTDGTIYRTSDGDFFTVAGETVLLAHVGGDEE